MAEFDWWSYGAFKLTPLAGGCNTGKSWAQYADHSYISEVIKTLLLHFEATKVNKSADSLIVKHRTNIAKNKSILLKWLF